MKKSLKTCLAAGMLMFGMTGVAHATVAYNANVTPNVVFGSGNSNGHFVVDTASNIEVGLRAKVRYQNVYTNDGAGTYSMPSGISSGTAAKWNYEFSINVNKDGQGTATLSDYIIRLNIDTDPTQGQQWVSLNPLTAFPDNATGGTNYLAQNSENIGWAGMNVNIPATYDFDLQVLSLTGATLAETAMRVNVAGGGAPAPVPEPSTVLLLGAGLAGIGLVSRRIKK